MRRVLGFNGYLQKSVLLVFQWVFLFQEEKKEFPLISQIGADYNCE